MTSYRISESLEEVEVVSRFKGLSGLRVLDSLTERRAGFMVIQMTVRNDRRGDFLLESQADWRDANGFVVDGTDSWEGTRIGRGETRDLTFTAGSRDAVTADISFRERHTVN